jgi:hypothetical protein
MLMFGPMQKFASTPSGKVAKAIANLAKPGQDGVFIHENESINALAG